MKIGIESNILRYFLRNVYFITGTAYAGKSTMVKLLSERFNGIQCGENYHMDYMEALDKQHQPNLTYINENTDWKAFVSRTPKEYNDWIVGNTKEVAGLEISILLSLVKEGRKIFVDTNIPLDILHEIADERHVLVMLSPQEVSVNRFFEREDKDKQFLYQVLMSCENPTAALENYKECLKAINSKEHYLEYKNSGFSYLCRDEERSIEDTFKLVCEYFQLPYKE